METCSRSAFFVVARDHRALPSQWQGRPADRTSDLLRLLRRWSQRMRTQGPESVPLDITDASNAVNRALRNADALLASTGGAASAVDRVHTALHGYLRQVCADAAIPYPEDPSATRLFRLPREHHPAFALDGPRQDDVQRVFNAHATVLDSLTPIRNRTSMAHPNPIVLNEPDAHLVVNTVRTVFGYIRDRLNRARGNTRPGRTHDEHKART